MSRDRHGAGNDLTNEQNIKRRMDEIARRYGQLDADDPEREILFSQVRILVDLASRLREMQGLA